MEPQGFEYSLSSKQSHGMTGEVWLGSFLEVMVTSITWYKWIILIGQDFQDIDTLQSRVWNFIIRNISDNFGYFVTSQV